MPIVKKDASTVKSVHFDVGVPWTIVETVFSFMPIIKRDASTIKSVHFAVLFIASKVSLGQLLMSVCAELQTVRLRCKQQLRSCYTCADALADSGWVVVSCVSVEVPTEPILAWKRMH